MKRSRPSNARANIAKHKVMATNLVPAIGADLAIDAACKGRRNEAIADLRALFALHLASRVRIEIGCTGDALVRGVVLDRAACAVTHGGMGATQKALARGVPVCVVPFGRDQFEVARRVEVAQCGTRLPAKKLTPDRLREKVRQAMTMPNGARRVAERFAATGGVTRGADLFEQRLLGLRLRLPFRPSHGAMFRLTSAATPEGVHCYDRHSVYRGGSHGTR